MTHLAVGLIALGAGVCGVVFWWDDFGEFLRGFVPMALILVGLAALGAGIRDRGDATDSDESDDAAPPEREGPAGAPGDGR